MCCSRESIGGGGRSSVLRGDVAAREVGPGSARFALGQCRQGLNEIPIFAVKCSRLPLSSRRNQTAKSTHRAHKIDDQHHECKAGGGAYFAFFLGFRQFRTSPPQKYHPMKGFCGDGAWLAVPWRKRRKTKKEEKGGNSSDPIYTNPIKLRTSQQGILYYYCSTLQSNFF